MLALSNATRLMAEASARRQVAAGVDAHAQFRAMKAALGAIQMDLNRMMDARRGEKPPSRKGGAGGGGRGAQAVTAVTALDFKVWLLQSRFSLANATPHSRRILRTT